MRETTNYNLKKIELTDSPPDITVLNNNWDTIDEELKSQADALDAHLAEITTQATANKIPRALENSKISPDWYSANSNITYYVDAVNGNDANDGLTSVTAFKTIQKSLDSLPKIINSLATINIADGTYNESVIVAGFMGRGELKIVCSPDVNILYLFIGYCSIAYINIQGGTYSNNYNRCTQVWYCSSWVYLDGIKCLQLNPSVDAVSFQQSRGGIKDSVMSNSRCALYVVNSQVSSENNSGEGNTMGLQAYRSTIYKIGSQPTGTTAEALNAGQIIG